MNTSFIFDINNTVGFMNSCNIDQAAIVEETTKLPKTGYYILLLGLACLLFYFFIQPKLSQKVRESLWESIGLMGTCFVFLSVWVLFFFVFQFSVEELRGLISKAWWLVLPLLLILGYKGFKKLKVKMNG